MSEIEKRILVAIEGVESKEASEALLLALHRLVGTENFISLLAMVRL